MMRRILQPFAWSTFMLIGLCLFVYDRLDRLAARGNRSRLGKRLGRW